MLKPIFVLGVVGLVGFAGYRYAHGNPASPEELVSQAAPDFTLDRIGGGTVTLSGLRGKVVVLDFWYRGCGWCMKAMPDVNKLAVDYKRQGVVVIGMNVDPNEADARAVMAQFGLRYDSVRATREAIKAFGVEGYPTTIVIDKKGNVRAAHVGYADDLAGRVEGEVRGLLAG